MLVRLMKDKISALTAVCACEHIYGSKIVTCLKTYGLEDARHHFYLCMEEDEVTAALYSDGGVLTVATNGAVDPKDVEEAARLEGVGEIECERSLCLTLQKSMGGTTEGSWFMVYRGDPITMDASDMAPADLRNVLDVLQRSHEFYRTHYTFDTWSVDLQKKLDKGLIEVYQLERNGEVIGTGMIGSQDDECATVMSVAVVPEYRHRGLGTYITKFLTARIQQMGKTPRLMPGYDEVAELYRQVGYVECGEWGELYL